MKPPPNNDLAASAATAGTDYTDLTHRIADECRRLAADIRRIESSGRTTALDARAIVAQQDIDRITQTLEALNTLLVHMANGDPEPRHLPKDALARLIPLGDLRARLFFKGEDRLAPPDPSDLTLFE
ncbi:MAG: hypothetical protein AAFR35_15125 [Pseudomonadota bacterium]